MIVGRAQKQTFKHSPFSVTDFHPQNSFARFEGRSQTIKVPKKVEPWRVVLGCWEMLTSSWYSSKSADWRMGHYEKLIRCMMYVIWKMKGFPLLVSGKCSSVVVPFRTCNRFKKLKISADVGLDEVCDLCVKINRFCCWSVEVKKKTLLEACRKIWKTVVHHALFCWKMMIIATRHHRRMRYRCPDVSWTWMIHGVIKKTIMHKGGPTDSATKNPTSQIVRCAIQPWLSLSRPRNSWSLSERWEVGSFGEKLVWWSLMVIDVLQMTDLCCCLKFLSCPDLWKSSVFLANRGDKI